MPVGKGYVITADSEPVLDGWGYDYFWGPNDWITWHKAMKAKFGLDEANVRFIKAYSLPDFGASSYDWRSFDDTFKAYAQSNGFYNALFTGIGGLIGKAANLTATVISKGADTATTVVESAASTVSSIAKAAKWVVPAVIIVVVIGVLIYLAKTNKIVTS